MKTTSTFLFGIILIFLANTVEAQKIGKVSKKVKATSSKKRSSSITISPYVLPRIDFVKDNEAVTTMRPLNMGVAGGLLFRLWFNENWGVFTGAGIGKRQFKYTAFGNSEWNGEAPGVYVWNTEYKHEKLLAEVQVGASWQYNFKKKAGSCARFGNRSTGWFFLADLGLLIAPEFKNDIFAKGSYDRYSNNVVESDLVESTSYQNWTKENENTMKNETQIALIIRPAVKYQMKNLALIMGPEFNLGLTAQHDLLNYRANSAYKIHTLGLFIAAEF